MNNLIFVGPVYRGSVTLVDRRLASIVWRSVPLRRAKTCPSTDGSKALPCIFK